jgi:hypothetical protein
MKAQHRNTVQGIVSFGHIVDFNRVKGLTVAVTVILWLLSNPASVARADELDPAIYVLVDTSGSMLMTVDGSQNTYGDGSSEHPHDGSLISRLYMAKQAIGTVVNAYGEVQWGLARFEQRSGYNYLCMCHDEIPNNVTGCGGFGGLWHPRDECQLCDVMADIPDYDLPATHDRVCINYAGGLFAGCTDPISGAPLTGADILVPLGADTEDAIISWINHEETDPPDPGYDAGLPPEQQIDPELRAVGGTPIGGSLSDIYNQLSWEIGSDPRRGCRPYAVIVLTDGAESCDTDPVDAATQLLSTPDLQRDCSAGCPLNSFCQGGHCRYEVRTYVIAFAVSPNEYLDCNEIAVAGNTGSAIPADNDTELVSAMADIIASSILTEMCNGIDDDCDSQIDEDYPDVGQFCNNGQLGQCYCSGVIDCTADGAGTECVMDPASATNPCGEPAYGFGAEADFGCDELDNDCDGLIDENLSCGTPPPDLCNGLDDDNDPNTPDGIDDPAVGQPCGSALGLCEPGSTECQGGQIVCQGETGPTLETCDGYDENCDGVIDGLHRACFSPGDGNGCNWDPGTETWNCLGQCSAGIQICQALTDPDPTNDWGPCLGEVVSEDERCDNVDNDCDGDTDENLSAACYPPGSGTQTGCTYDEGNDLWSCLGQCAAGVRTCTAGVWGSCAGYTSPTLEACDNLDNDCDGDTDEAQDIPGLGLPCGLALGRCTAGTLACIDGVEVCEGGTGPFAGECNGEDDDCDGQIDEMDEIQDAIGQPCGNDVGVCEPGTTECLGGELVCSGGTQPTDELCDGLDNDCDGEIDNDAYCPPESWCYMGACRVACEPGEFPCPSPLVCQTVTVEGVQRDLCVPSGELCGDEICPDGWICVDEECVDPCDPNPCQDWQQCISGVCYDASCTSNVIQCPPGQFCHVHQCVTDPCLQADCDPISEYCVRNCDPQGHCEAVCEPLCTCGPAEICNAEGTCVPDPCLDVSCTGNEICIDGECVTDPCEIVVCELGEMCFMGECMTDPCQNARCPAHTHCARRTTADGHPQAHCVPNSGVWVEGGEGIEVNATGSGGVGCNVAATRSGSGAGSNPASLWWGFLLLTLLGVRFFSKKHSKRKKRPQTRHAMRPKTRPKTQLWGGCGFLPLLIATAVALGGAGCNLDGYDFSEQGHWELPDGFVPFPDGGARRDSGPQDACVPADEICDEQDNDCDGLTDEDFDLQTNPQHCGQCNHPCQYENAYGVCTDGQCSMGDCLPGYWDNNTDPADGCEYPCFPTNDGQETCDGIDNDCDGQSDEDFDLQTDPQNCGQCNRVCAFFQGAGDCVGGECVLASCNASYADKDGDPANGCECLITDTEDLCDGVDNDCDSETDEDSPIGGACYTHPTGCSEDPNNPGQYLCDGQCHAGNMTCENGTMVCTAQQGPQGELCNDQDDDCDGDTDEDFDLETDMANCGSCNYSCFDNTPAGTYAIGCAAHACQYACLPGHIDQNGDLDQGMAGNGCEYVCSQTAPQDTEYCDGEDNDCDGQTDESVDLVSPPANLCKEQSTTPCDDVPVVCQSGVMGTTWYCQYPAGVETDAQNPNLVLTVETLCDGFDGNCDGNVDEAFNPPLGETCDDGNLGVCRGTGTYQCNNQHDGTECVIDNPGQSPQNEVCDAVDNDCDGLTDESYANRGTNPSYVQDDVVTINVGGDSVIVYRYEASRPTASAADEGSQSNVRACSRAGVLPWSKVTYEQARQACQKAGMTLCTESEWAEACNGQSTTWAYPYDPSTYNASACNGAEAGFGQARPTGSLPDCASNGYAVEDLSGNLREWTSTVVAYTEDGKAIYALRGGSYTEMADGLRCDFESSALIEDAFTANVGFRCCTRCGNGVLDPGEQCDDGNLDPNDSCSPVCGPPTCGDGIVDTNEDCDCGTNPNNLPAGCIAVNGAAASNCAINCVQAFERCSSLYPEDQDDEGEVDDCADPDCAGTWCGDVSDNDGDGFSEADGDCDDTDPNISPAADENCQTAYDDNCNGFVNNDEPDKDGDGELRCVGGVENDCNDWDPEMSPALIEICGDGIDNDCDGNTDSLCASACEIAAFERSYIGCEYWPTPTANSQLDNAFNNNFGVAVFNDNTNAVTATVYRGGVQVAQQSIPAHSSHTFTLALDTGLKQTYGYEETVKVQNAAYRLTSTEPVTVYQFNPLDYRLDVQCDYDPENETPPCYSYSNDAALLLPTHVLGQHHIAMARQGWGLQQYYWNPAWCSTNGDWNYYGKQSMMAIVGTENNTSVTVTFSAYTEGGDVSARNPNDQVNYTLDRGEVLQFISRWPSAGTACPGTVSTELVWEDPNSPCEAYRRYCDMGPQYDLTSTVVESSAPVAVFSGHNCAFVPYDIWACDHLEEQMFPTATWGRDFVVTRTEPQNMPVFSEEPNVIRVVSGADANAIDFEPAQPVVGGNIVLNEGDWVEFESGENFHVSGTEALMVTQFLVGQDYYSNDPENWWGDPAYALAVPTEQFRTSYRFLVPDTITYHWLNVIKPVGIDAPTVYLDGAPIPEGIFSGAIGDSYFGVARMEISNAPYTHVIESDQPFGIMVYGFARYTSYFYPGGLDLNLINAEN